VPQLIDRLRAALAPEYALEREIARGGMSHVFLARDTVLERPVAVKLLRPELAGAREVERFVRESRILANLSHPNLLPVHRAGVADGLFWYITDYMPGDTLADRLRRGPLTPAEATALGADLLAALEAAHEAGVVHRDIKPGNIFLRDGRAVLADFGIARVIGALQGSGTVGDDRIRTASSPATITGTPGYMAPEQLQGECSPRTDLYAAGLVLYEAMTGRAWQNAAPADRKRWLGVPPRLVPVLHRALEPDPADRWPDAAAFRRALLASAKSPGRRALAAALGAAVLLLLGWVFLPRPEPPVEWSLVIAPLTLEEGLPPRFEISGRIAQDLQLVPGLKVPFENRTVQRRLQRGVHQAGESHAARSFGTEYLARGSAHAVAGGIRVRITIYDRAGQARWEVAAESGDADSLAAAAAFRMLQKLAPELRAGRDGWLTDSFVAFRHWLQGERALRGNRWREAGLRFRDALDADPAFLMAAVRIGEVRDWMPWEATGPPVDLARLFAQFGHTLEPLDSLIVEARLKPIGATRLHALQQLRASHPHHPQIASYYADELFHRGPFLGYGTDAAIRAFEEAVRLDDSFAPAYEHLAWAYVQQGIDAAAALHAVRHFAAHTHTERGSLHDPVLLEAAIAIRFGNGLSDAQWHGLATAASSEEYLLRQAMAAALPEAQLELARRVAAREATAAGHARALQAGAIALLATGRVGEGIAALDTAATLFGEPEYALQAAEWRVLPAVLGWPAVDPDEAERARAVLRRAAGRPDAAARAAWTLGMDAVHRGDLAEARRQRAALDRTATAAATRLAALLDAWLIAWDGDVVAALARSRPLHGFVTADQFEHPFARAALFLGEARWLEALGDSAGAARHLLWAEHADVHALRGPIRAAEVDWVFGTLAAAERARLAAGDDHLAPAACRRFDGARGAWQAADSAFVPLREAFDRLAAGPCRP
jgi:tRNA A-37 threonylcarbamoyl transferase component Bud32